MTTASPASSPIAEALMPLLSLLLGSISPRLDRLSVVEALARLSTLLLRAVCVSRSGGATVLLAEDEETLAALAERCTSAIGALAAQELAGESLSVPATEECTPSAEHVRCVLLAFAAWESVGGAKPAVSLEGIRATAADREGCNNVASIARALGAVTPSSAPKLAHALEEAAQEPSPARLTGEDVSRVLHLYAAACTGAAHTFPPLFSACSVKTFAEDAGSCADLAMDANDPAQVEAGRAKVLETDNLEHAAAHLLDLLAGSIAESDVQAAELIGGASGNPANVRAFLASAEETARKLFAPAPVARKSAPRRKAA